MGLQMLLASRNIQLHDNHNTMKTRSNVEHPSITAVRARGLSTLPVPVTADLMGRLKVKGDRALLNRFAACFPR